MRPLHDPAVRSSIRARVQSLTPNAVRRWGKMSVDQMLWHVNEGLRWALGERQLAPVKTAMPKPLLKFFVLNLPWPKGVPTHPSLVAGDRHYFDEQKARCLDLVDAFVARSIDARWPDSPGFGPVDGRFMSRFHHKHLDHHLKQFSA